MCKIKSVGIKKMFKQLPVLLCENETTTAMNYLILALTAYKVAAEVIFDRLVNATIAEFQELKSQLLENEERIIKDIEGNTIEERTMNLITWFMHNDISDISEKPKSTTSFGKADKGMKPQKEKKQKELRR